PLSVGWVDAGDAEVARPHSAGRAVRDRHAGATRGVARSLLVGAGGLRRPGCDAAGGLRRHHRHGIDPGIHHRTAKRVRPAPPRRVLHRYGRWLDLERMVAMRPQVESDWRPAAGPRPDPGDLPPLGDERLDTIVAALVEVIFPIASGRRDLFLALPGALLDR